MMNKVFILILGFVGLVSTFTLANVDLQKCQKRFGNFPVEGSLCKSFYKCTNWSPVEVKCPGNKHFFPEREACVWPDEYPCFEKPKPCPRANGKFLKVGTGCREFYDCRGGIPAEKRCPDDLLFSPRREICDYPEYAACVEDITKSTPSTTFTAMTTTNTPSAVITVSTVMPSSTIDINSSEESGESSESGGSSESNESTETGRSSTVSDEPSSRILKSTTTSSSTLDINSSEESGESSESGGSSESNESTETGRSSTVSDEPSSRNLESTTTPSSTFDIFSTEESGESSVTDQPSTISDEPSSINLESTTTPSSTFDIFSTGESGESSVTEQPSTISVEPSSRNLESTTTPSSTFDINNTEESSQSSETGSPSTVFVASSSTTLESTTTPSSTLIGASSEESSKYSPSAVPSTSSIQTLDDHITSEVTSKIPVDDKSTIIFENKFSTISSIEPSHPSTIGTSTDDAESTVYDHDITSGSSGVVSSSDSGTFKFTYSTTATKVTDPVTINIFCPEPDGYFPHPNDRHKFIGCVRGNPSIMDCPANLVYDNENRRCDYEML